MLNMTAVNRCKQKGNVATSSSRGRESQASGRKSSSWGGVRFGTRLVDSRTLRVSASPAAAFAPIRRIGGANGWYFANALWWLRGFLDLLVGGVGMRRGRRNAETLTAGDALDFWRVEAFDQNHSLSLVAEMKVPGRAWLQFEVEPIGAQPDSQQSIIHQTAIFDPAGLCGLLHWCTLYPIHRWIFSGMLGAIAARAELEPGATLPGR